MCPPKHVTGNNFIMHKALCSVNLPGVDASLLLVVLGPVEHEQGLPHGEVGAVSQGGVCRPLEGQTLHGAGGQGAVVKVG